MLPCGSNSSSASTLIKYEAEDQVDIKLEEDQVNIKLEEDQVDIKLEEDQVDIKLEFKEEPSRKEEEQKEKEIMERASEFLNEPSNDEIKNVNDFATEMQLNENPTTETETKPTSSLSQAPVPAVLKIHLCTHTQEKPLKCPESQCKTSFNRKQDLEYHLFCVHGKNEKNHKVFRCELCPFQTIRKHTFQFHSKVHNPTKRKIKCPHQNCSFQCSYESALTFHIQRMHFKEKPFRCPQYEDGCYYEGSVEQDLKSHLVRYHRKSREQVEDILKQQIYSSRFTTEHYPVITKTRREPQQHPYQNQHESSINSTKNIHPNPSSKYLDKSHSEFQFEEPQEKQENFLQSSTQLFLNQSAECTNKNEIEPELVELKYEIEEENWMDESEENPIK